LREEKEEKEGKGGKSRAVLITGSFAAAVLT